VPRSRSKPEDGFGGAGPAWDPKLGVLTSGNGHVNQLDRDGKTRIYRKDGGGPFNNCGHIFFRIGRWGRIDSAFLLF
jgi:hypothetical protein